MRQIGLVLAVLSRRFRFETLAHHDYSARVGITVAPAHGMRLAVVHEPTEPSSSSALASL